MQPKTNPLYSKIYILAILLIAAVSAQSQRTREVQEQNHFWWSVNSVARISDRFSIVGDLHIRRTDFLKNNNFFYTRLGLGYHITEQLSVQASGGHMWLANRNGATELFSNETRLVEQIQLQDKIGRVQVSHRLRVEQRWVQRVVNFQPVDATRYLNRYRYQVGILIPVSKNTKLPRIAVVDELLLQSGKDIVYNHFDQNRLFLGLRQQVTPSLAFDFGYMQVFQQRLSGYQYNRNHTIRWFFFWQPDWRKKKPAHAFAEVTLPDMQ